MRLPRLGVRGMIGLAMCVATMVCLVILSTGIVVTLRSLKRLSLYQQKLLQAQLLAEAGAQDALLQLSLDGTWRAGFSQKAMKDGYYTVTLSNDARPWITATGYSASVALLGRAFRTIRLRAEPSPVPQMIYGLASDRDMIFYGSARIDSYNSESDPTPGAFSSTAKVWSNMGVSFARTFYSVYGTCNYRVAPAPAAWTVSGLVTLSTYTVNLSSNSSAPYAADNDNLTGLSPQSFLLPASRNVNIPLGQTATLKSGTYYFNDLIIAGTLTLVIDDGPVNIYLTDDLILTGALVNPTQYPSNLFIRGTSGAERIDINSATPFFGVIESKDSDFNLYSTMYGAVIAEDVTLYDGARMHQDLSLQRNKVWATRPMAGTWSSLATRQ